MNVHLLQSHTANANQKLRAELADANANRRKAEQVVSAAKVAFTKLEQVMRDAGREVERLKSEQAAAKHAARERRSDRIAAAYREKGTDAAITLVDGVPDNPALADAIERYEDLLVAAGKLQAEYRRAEERATHARAQVNWIIERIQDDEVRVLGAELVELQNLLWRLVDRTVGYELIDCGRNPPQLRDFLLEVRTATANRQTAAAKHNPQILEPHKFNAYMDELEGEQKRRWLDYAARLREDATAVFPSPWER